MRAACVYPDPVAEDLAAVPGLNDLMARLERAEERAKELDLAFAWQASRSAVSPAPDAELAALHARADALTEALTAVRDDLYRGRAEHQKSMESLQAAIEAARRVHPAAPDSLEKQVAANEARLAALHGVLADLTRAVAHVPAAREESGGAPWRMPLLVFAVLALALCVWQVTRHLGASASAPPASEAALLDQAGEAFVHQDYAGAEGLYRQVLQKSPKQDEARRGLGHALLLESERVLHALPPP